MSVPLGLRHYPARTTLPALDLERAKRFYSEILGLRIVVDTADGVAFETGEASPHPARHGWAERATFFVYPTPNPMRGGHTQMGFLVDDMESTVATLRVKGVAFEDYDQPGLTTSEGIAAIANGHGKGAWFKDSEGNLIGLVQFG